jgi:hypothetical protein
MREKRRTLLDHHTLSLENATPPPVLPSRLGAINCASQFWKWGLRDTRDKRLGRLHERKAKILVKSRDKHFAMWGKGTRWYKLSLFILVILV